MCFICVAHGRSDGLHPSHIAYNATGGSDQSAGVRTSAFTTGPEYVTALLFGQSWTSTFNQSVQVDYTYDGTTFNGSKNALVTQRVTEEVLQKWENVANIDFRLGTGTSELQFTTATLAEDESGEVLGVAYIFTSGTRISSVEVQIDTDYAVEDILAGTTGYQTMVHEIGHALGLKHPFDDASGTGLTLDGAFDSWDFTVMSYTAGQFATANRLNTGPMLFDIAAAQYLYGANTSYNAGDNTYVIDGTAQSYAIWDAGGTDTIITNVGSQDVLIDLTDTYEFESEFLLDGRTPGLNLIGETVFFPAFGSNIENAVAGSGNDTIDGGDGVNTLTGGLGEDIIDGWDSNDVIYGGRGLVDGQDSHDLIRGDFGADYLVGNNGDDTIFGGGGIYLQEGYEDLDTAVREDGVKDRALAGLNLSLIQIHPDDTDSSDTIYGGYGSDVIYGNGGNDELFGGGTAADPLDLDDVIIGGRGTDTIYGNGGDDLILGGHALADTADSRDVIYAGFGNDTIYGNAGNDIIWSGPGNDSVVGGTGEDLLVFYDNTGIDTILGFEGPGDEGGDTIYIYNYSNNTDILTAQQVIDRITYSGTRAEIDLGNSHQIIILGVEANSITTADIFVFGF